MKYRILLTIMAFILTATGMKADLEKTPYQWEIRSLSPYYPENWVRVQDSANFDGIEKSIDYSVKTMQFIGSDSFTALAAPSQTLFKDNSNQGEYIQVNDYLVSPPLKGELNFYVKRFSEMDAASHKICSVKLFPAIKNSEGSFTIDTANEIVTNFDEIFSLMQQEEEREPGEEKIADYHKLTAQLGAQYRNIAFRFDYVDVANLSAESAMVPGIRSVKLEKVLLGAGGQAITLNADAQGKATLKCRFYLKNDGNEVLNADDPKYYGMLALMNDDNNYSQSVKGSLPTLQPGESGTSDIEFTFNIPDTAPDVNGKIKVRIDGFAFLDGESQQTYIGTGYAATINVIPYKGILAINYDGKAYSPGTPEKPTYIDLGCFHVSKSVEVKLINNGPAPLVINGIDAPSGVTFDLLSSLPLTIQPGTSNQLTETITLAGEYLTEGGISLLSDGLGTDVIYLRGMAIPEETAFYDFESGAFPARWYPQENNTGKWEILSNPVTSDKNNKKSLRHSNSSYPSSVTTGRIHFDEGDQLHFDIALRSTSSGELTVRISPNRSEWTEVAKSGSEQLIFPTKSSTWQSYSIDIPEGDWYVDFYGAYLYIDNIYGGKEAPLAVDIAPVSVAVGKTMMVNHPLDVVAAFRNMGQSLSSYQVQLEVDGEPVAEIPGDEFISGEEKYFNLSYYPHTSGEKEIIVAILPADGEEIISSPLEIEIEEEASRREVEIGISKGTKEEIPMKLYDKNSRSEYVYSADKLGFGRCNISGIAYDFYTSGYTDAEITKTRIWMQNTEDSNTSAGYTDTTEMTLVYEFDGNPDWERGGNVLDLQRMRFNFDTPFEYTGGNLRVSIESNATNYCKTLFAYDDSDSNILYSSADKLDDFIAKTPTSAKFMPVTHFTTESDPVVVTGNVTEGKARNSEGNGIEGVMITAKAKDTDVLYSALTNTEGVYQLPIIQTDKEYRIVAEHISYKDVDSQDVDFTNPVHNFLLEKLSTGIENIEEELDGDPIYFNLQGLRIDNPNSGIYIRIINGKREKVIVK